MPTLHENPLFDQENSGSDDTASSTSSIDGDDLLTGTTIPPTAVLQTVNIRSHVPVTLEFANPNYDEWHCFFDTFLGKFGLTSHISSPPTSKQRHDSEWRLRDQCIVSWLYLSIAKDVDRVPRLDRHP
jgi:hypothetical protein